MNHYFEEVITCGFYKKIKEFLFKIFLNKDSDIIFASRKDYEIAKYFFEIFKTENNNYNIDFNIQYIGNSYIWKSVNTYKKAPLIVTLISNYGRLLRRLLNFLYQNKIYSREELQKANINVMAKKHQRIILPNWYYKILKFECVLNNHDWNVIMIYLSELMYYIAYLNNRIQNIDLGDNKKAEIRRFLDKTIYLKEFKSEALAYNLITSSRSVKDELYDFPYEFQLISKNELLEGFTEKDKNYALDYLNYLHNYGIISITPENIKVNSIATKLLVLPYYEYIKVLLEITRFGFVKNRTIKFLNNYVRLLNENGILKLEECNKIVEDLLQILELLNSCGQKLNDWDIVPSNRYDLSEDEQIDVEKRVLENKNLYYKHF